MSFTDAIKSVFSQYATFSGRARRSEYWYFLLFCGIVSVVVSYISLMLLNIFSLVTLIPLWAVTFRRLHDTGRSGWLFGLYFLVGVSTAVACVLFPIGSEYSSIPDEFMRGLVIACIFIACCGLYLLVLFCTDSDPGANRYGSNPKEKSSSAFRQPIEERGDETKSAIINDQAYKMHEKQLALCPNCFAPMYATGQCCVCGYSVACENAEINNKLDHGIILKDRYYVGKSIGHNKISMTYLGYDIASNHKIFIKEYYPIDMAVRAEGNVRVACANAQNAENFHKGMKKFLSEAKTLCDFVNPNIVGVLESFACNGTAYMVMEHLVGKPLSEYLVEHGGKLTFAETYKLLLPIMDALNAMHAQGLIFNELSPDSIFVTKECGTKLFDLGIGTSPVMPEKYRNCSIKLIKGYSPSELYREDGKIGEWSDVYSMAAVFYRCLTGEAPQDAIDRLFNDKIQDIRQKVPFDTTENVVLAILKAMSIKESDRFQNISDFRTAVEEKIFAKKVPNVALTSPEYPAKQKKKLCKVIYVVAGLFIIGACAVSFNIFSKGNLSIQVSGAEVWVDGNKMSVAPCVISLKKGYHYVAVYKHIGGSTQEWGEEVYIPFRKTVSPNVFFTTNESSTKQHKKQPTAPRKAKKAIKKPKKKAILKEQIGQTNPVKPKVQTSQNGDEKTKRQEEARKEREENLRKIGQ